MKTASLADSAMFKNDKPAINVFFETDSTKEIRIVMKKGQIMKEHKTAFPIVVEIFEGELDFGVNGKVLSLVKGDLLSLESNVPHDLTATQDCTIRLSLSKQDNVDRVRSVVD